MCQYVLKNIQFSIPVRRTGHIKINAKIMVLTIDKSSILIIRNAIQ